MKEGTWKVLMNDFKRRKIGNKYDGEYAGLYLTDDFGGRLARCVDKMALGTGNFRLLDIGCGVGLLMPLLKDKVREYVGIDQSKEMIEKAIKKNTVGFNMNFVCLDRINQAGGKFNVATMMDVVEHVEDKDLRLMLEDLKKVLKGRLFIHTPNGEYFMEKLKDVGVLPQISGHIAVRNGNELAALLTRAGFHVTRIDYMPHYTPLLRWTDWLSGLPKIGKYFKARLWIEAYC